jgi:hypothetical protein
VFAYDKMIVCQVSSELASWNMSMTEMLVSFSGRILPRERITLGMRGRQANVKCDAGLMNDWTKQMSGEYMALF